MGEILAWIEVTGFSFTAFSDLPAWYMGERVACKAVIYYYYTSQIFPVGVE